MSITIDKTSSARTDWRGRTMLWRFVWKEFRMTRGLWLAVAIMGFAIQCAAKLLVPPSSELPLSLFFTALAFAVLYSAGAAATTFSVEHEEETYDFLARLPARWWSVFFGKILVISVSAMSLAAALSMTGWALSSPKSLSGEDAAGALGMLGFAIVEALAWGIFFSLLIRRPLLAAIMTLVAGGVVVNLAVNLNSTYAVASLSPDAYLHAIPSRLAVVVAVFACSVAIARGWLSAGARPAIADRLRKSARFSKYFAGSIGRWRRSRFVAERGSRRRLLPRLLWQTWRECWMLLLFPLFACVLLFLALAAVLGLSHPSGEVSAIARGSTALFIPALYGAMAFYADQRRRNYQFLAEHAASPRYVWFARHAVWLSSLILIQFLLIGLLAAFVAADWKWMASQSLDNYIQSGPLQYPGIPSLVYQLTTAASGLFRVASVAMFGGLVAYGIGQLCSMAIRSEILAAFIAVLLSIVITAWIAVLVAWQLAASLFLLPLFAGLMAATWLRAPDWIAGRNSLRAWLKPALAVIAPLLLVALLLPPVRRAQVPTYQHAIEVKLHDFKEKANTPDARETAEMYLRVAEPLAVYARRLSESEAFHTAKANQDELVRKETEAAIKTAIEASKRPTCRFEFNLHSIGIEADDPNPRADLGDACPLYGKLHWLLMSVLLDLRAPDETFERLLAGLRMSAHLRAGQPSVVFIDQLKMERKILQWIGNWAADDKRTKEELRGALDKLTHHFYLRPSPSDALLADHLLVRDVLTGKDTPMAFAALPIPLHNYLAYMANQLPWERERAIAALDRITLRNIHDVTELIKRVADTPPGYGRRDEYSLWLRLGLRYAGLPELWEIQEPAAATSYLAALEYRARTSVSELKRAYCNDEVCRRAARLQIALALYRLDHKQYPPRLTDLVSEYLVRLPVDLYSGEPFAYEPAGLNFPLQWQGREPGDHRIEAHTPLFWSVGAGNLRLKQTQNTQIERADESNPESQGQEIAEPVYHLLSNESGWWDDDVLAFPLAK